MSFQATQIQKLREEFNNNHLYIKRDDLFPFSFGGNKARKALLFFNIIEEQSYDCVVTYGSSCSNHCRVISNIAAAKGIPCYIVSPNESNNKSFNSIMMQLFGANIIQCPIKDVSFVIDNKLRKLEDKGYKPYFIQGGGHGDIGTQSYVEAYNEIVQFENENDIYFDYIFLASGTGTTQAGLICGQLINNDCRKIIGISIARKNPQGSQVILESVNNYLEHIKVNKVSNKVISFVDNYVLNGYGSYNSKIINTIKHILINEGIPFDSTYTGKAYWGMNEYIKNNHIKGKNILFIHTGGTPLFFDDLIRHLS